MKKENQSRSDERIRKLNEQCAALQVEMTQQRKEDKKEIDELKKDNLRKKAEQDKENAERDKKISELKEENLKKKAEQDKEISELRKENAERDKKISELKEENLKKKAEQDKEISELRKENAERDKKISELKEKFLKEDAERKKENAERKKEDAERKKESDERLKRIEKQIEENGKQIGGLGNKFGGYTEAMAMPSIRRILEERFNADFLGPIQYKSNKELAALEVDAWGLSRNGTGVAYIVETKSKFRDEHIEQIWKLVERFRCYREEQAVYPMLAAVQISEEQRQRVWAEGIYLIDINEGVFRYAEPPKGFKAKGYHGVHRVQRSVPQLRLAVGGVEKPRRAE